MIVAAGLLIGISVGGMITTSFLVAPILFVVLDHESARAFTRALWPRYFALNGAVAGAAGLILLAARADVPYAVGAALVSAVLMAVNYGLAGRLTRLRDRQNQGDEGAEARAERYHRVTVVVNYVCLLLNGYVFVQVLLL